jgi:hypothetical protein
VDLPASTAWNFNDNILIAAILQADVLSGFKTIAGWGDAPSGRGAVFNMSGANLNFAKLVSTDAAGTALTALVAGPWFAVMVHTGTGLAATFRRFNLSSEAMASETVADAGAITVPATDPGRIGEWLAGGSRWNGRIAEVGLWNRGPFSEPEFLDWILKALDNRGTEGFTTNLKGYWALEGTASPEPDSSGNGNDGTLVGTAFATEPPAVGSLGLLRGRFQRVAVPMVG